MPTVPAGSGSPARLLDVALAADGGRPLLTWYDDATGERIELSVATFANWVAKTAGLTDGLGAGPGDVVRLDAPPAHWHAVVWTVATWRAGCVLDPYPGRRPALVAVTGPDGPAAGSAPADEVVALSLRPLGAPFAPGTLPPGALDFAREVPLHPDRYGGPYAGGDDPAARDADGRPLTGAALVERAGALADGWGAGDGARLLVHAPGRAPVHAPGPAADRPADPLDLLLAASLVPLVLDGSVVLVRNAGPGSPAGRAAQERVTATGNP